MKNNTKNSIKNQVKKAGSKNKKSALQHKVTFGAVCPSAYKEMIELLKERKKQTTAAASFRPIQEADLKFLLEKTAAKAMIVYDINGRCVGYCIHQGKRLIDICVKKSLRRQGIGGALLAKVMQRKRLLKKMFALVGETNLPAQLFFKKQGWFCTEIVKNKAGESYYRFEWFF